jgi:AcrR family transcriptional regulator
VRPRTRRSTEEIEKLILDSARCLFSERGYWGTSTREVADTAGVAEILIFRHFGSKAELFSMSVMLPMIEFIEQWSEQWINEDESLEVAKIEDRQYDFISRFYRLVGDNRGLIVSYLAMSVFEPDLISGLEHSARLQRAVERLVDHGTELLSRGAIGSSVNVPVTVRASLAMFLAMPVLHDFTDPSKGRRFSLDEVITEMTQLILYGTLNRPSAMTSAAEQTPQEGARQPSGLGASAIRGQAKKRGQPTRRSHPVRPPSD